MKHNEGLIKKIIKSIGDEPGRDGLVGTPSRVVKMWREIFSGYQMDPKELLKTFDKDSYNEMIILKDIEFYSMCEHHMLPFYGKGHIAYIPKDKVIGISKLARLLEIFTRRLQTQERICEQVTDFLINNLECEGAACVLEAQHLCMTMRGIKKQNSVMVTSSLKGVFKDKIEVRSEMMKLIK